MADFTKTTLNYPVGAPTPIRRVAYPRAPTTSDFRNFIPGDEWLDTDSTDWWKFVERTGSPSQGLWVKIGGTGGAAETFNIDAATPPGTDPVVPSALNEITITGAQTATGTIGANVIRTDSLAANTITIEIQRSTDAAAPDSTLNGVCHFDSGVFSVNNDGFVGLTGGGTIVQEFDVDSSVPPGTDPVLPDASGTVTVTGGAVASGVVGTNVIRTNSLAANTYTIEIQIATDGPIPDPGINGVSHFDDSAFVVDSQGFVQLLGGGQAIESVNVDASTPPGTSPVVPDATGQISVTGAQVASGTVGANVIRTDSLAVNTYTIEIQRSADAAAPDSTLNGVSHFDSAAFSVDADAFVSLLGGGQAVEEFLPDTGTSPVVPNASGQVSVIGQATPNTSGIQVTGGTNSLNISMFSPFVGDFTFTESTAGNTETLTVSNTDNTAANDSGAGVAISVGGATQIGDPYVQFNIGSSESWAIGKDVSDSRFFIRSNATSSGATPSSGDAMVGLTITGTGTPGAFTMFGGQVVHITDAIVAGFPYTVLAEDYVVEVDTSLAPVSVILDSSTTSGQVHIIKDDTGDAATNNITVTATSGNIDGAASYVIDTDFGSVAFVNDVTAKNNWYILADFEENTLSSDQFLPDTGTSPVVPNASGQVSVIGQGTPNTSGIQVTGGTNALNISMFSPFVGDFTFTESTAGNTETLTVSNTDNTAANASSAAVALSVGGSTQIGDPYVQFNIGSSESWAIGKDVTDTRFFVRSNATSSGVTASSGDAMIGLAITGAGTPGAFTMFGGQIVHMTVALDSGFPYTVLATDYVVLVDTSVARSVILDASTTSGQMHIIKDEDGTAATNNITITTTSGNIDGSASYVINSNYGSVTVVNDVANTNNWYVI